MATILVADDEPAMRGMIRMACERLGHKVFEAIDAPTTLQRYKECDPNLLVLDLSMPGGGGVWVLNSLRFGGVHALCPVLVVTGSVEHDAGEIKRILAVERVLLKPFRIADLAIAVRTLLPPSAPSPSAKPPTPAPAPPSASPPTQSPPSPSAGDSPADA